MNRKELIAEITKQTSLSSLAANKVLEAFISTVKNTVKSGKDIRLVGFGMFKLGKRAERIGINPQTKEKIQLKAVNIPKFKAGKSFKKLVN
ncbi:MAG: HU family DNA-binding protein [bacterium]